jgi:pyruvyltransferase
MLKKQNLLNSSKRVLKSIVFRNRIPCFWSKSDNWGDALSPYLVKKISSKITRYEDSPYTWKNFVIGSILHRVDNFSIIWGSGMLSPEALPKNKPHSVHAVRGPLTRDLLLKSGINCPDVFGDPALLLPRFYSPTCKIKWKIGVIAHYADQGHPWIDSLKNKEGVNIINIRSSTESFVNEVLSCECIVSSSLHGLICADAYGIPSIWIGLSDLVVGNGYKFYDYYASIKRPVAAPIRINNDSNIDNVVSRLKTFCIDIDLDRLYESCPFK